MKLLGPRTVGMRVYPVGAGSPSNRSVVSAGVVGFHTCMSGCPAFCWNCHDVESLQRFTMVARRGRVAM